MAESENVSNNMVVRLNDVLDLLGAINSNNLRSVLGQGRIPGVNLTGCTTDCTCKGGMCGCNTIVTSREGDWVSYPEFMRMREARLAELREQMAALEIRPDEVDRSP